jgi:hypothetical protein
MSTQTNTYTVILGGVKYDVSVSAPVYKFLKGTKGDKGEPGAGGGTAAEVEVNPEEFSGNLGETDTNVQAALETIDQLALGASAAEAVAVDTEQFSGNLGDTDTNVQAALETIDQLALGASAAEAVAVDTEQFSGNLGETDTNVQAALETIDQLEISNGGAEVGEIRQFTGGAPSAEWLACDGSAYLQSAYAALYAAVGLLHDFAGWSAVAVTTGAEKFCEAIGGNHAGRVWSGGYSRMSYSDDFGLSWTTVESAGYAQNIGVEYISTLSRLVVGGQVGRIYTSDDGGASYTRRDDAGSPAIDPMDGQGVNCSINIGGVVYLAGEGGKICKTANGIDYDKLTFGDSTAIVQLAYGNGILVATTAARNNVRWSDDLGTTWNAATYGGTVPAAMTITDMIWSESEGMFIRCSHSNSSISVSLDGKRWTNGVNMGVGNLFAICECQNSFIFGSSAGLNVQVPKSRLGGLGTVANIFTAAPNTGTNARTLFLCSNGNLLRGEGRTVAYNWVLNKSYNAATSFRVPSPVLDGVAPDTYIYAGS